LRKVAAVDESGIMPMDVGFTDNIGCFRVDVEQFAIDNVENVVPVTSDISRKDDASEQCREFACVCQINRRRFIGCQSCGPLLPLLQQEAPDKFEIFRARIDACLQTIEIVVKKSSWLRYPLIVLHPIGENPIVGVSDASGNAVFRSPYPEQE
jgi:hypothetical protein